MPSSQKKNGTSNTQSSHPITAANQPLLSSPSSTSTTMTPDTTTSTTTNAAASTALRSPPPTEVRRTTAPSQESASQFRAKEPLFTPDLENIMRYKLSRRQKQEAEKVQNVLPPMRDLSTKSGFSHPMLMSRDEYLARQNRVFEELTGFNSWAEYKRHWVAEDEKDDPLARITEMVIAGLDESVYNEFQEQRYIMDEIDYAGGQAVKSIMSHTKTPDRQTALEANYALLKGQISRLEIEFSKMRIQKLELETLRQQTQSEYQQEAIRRQKIEVICKALVNKVEDLEYENKDLQKTVDLLEKRNTSLEERLARAATVTKPSTSSPVTSISTPTQNQIPPPLPTSQQEAAWKVTAAANAEAILAAQDITSGYSQYINERIQGNVDNSRNLAPILKSLDGLLETYSDVIEKFKASSLGEEDWKSMLTAILKQYRARAELFEHVLSEKDLLYSIYAAKCKSLHEELEVTRNRALVLTESYMEIFSSKDPLEAMSKLRDKHESVGEAADAITAAATSKATTSSTTRPTAVSSSLGKRDMTTTTTTTSSSVAAPTDSELSASSSTLVAEKDLWLLRLYSVEQLMSQKEAMLRMLESIKNGDFSKEDLGKVWDPTMIFRMFEPIDKIEAETMKHITFDEDGHLDGRALFERFKELTRLHAIALFEAVPTAQKGLFKLHADGVLGPAPSSTTSKGSGKSLADDQLKAQDKREGLSQKKNNKKEERSVPEDESAQAGKERDGILAAATPLIPQQPTQIVTGGNIPNGSALSSDTKISPGSVEPQQSRDGKHGSDVDQPPEARQTSTSTAAGEEKEAPSPPYSADRENIPEISPKRLRNVIHEYFSYAPATADFFKKQFGFDLTGKTFAEVLLEFASKGEHDCHDTDCPIHHSTAEHRPAWNEVVESMFSGVNGGGYHQHQQRRGDDCDASNNNDDSGVGSFTFGRGDTNASKPMFGPERPPALQV